MVRFKWSSVCLCLAFIFCQVLISPAADQSTTASDVDWTEWEEDEEELIVWDPIEPINRGIFWVNDKLYFYLLKPVARGYRWAVPEPGREAVDNVFNNLNAPVRILNSFLQGKVQNGLDELTKFCANSIFGIAGIFNLHSETEPQPSKEDFGQTLGDYGIGPGFYLVLPVFGPSNLRDGVGLFADRLVEPIPSPYYFKMHDYEVWALGAYQQVNWLSLDKDTYESIKRDALDPYLFVRNAYMQKRAAEIDK
ncbi:MAG: VacJ family lipoprotein [Deltaproteobacteria bacterium]|jgi:phospholipid-binding lipoprotein MlaA|nr:VacJ family lipoprotein [Deltaproteobacteria bacterium]